jgi:chemotaxis protein CheD
MSMQKTEPVELGEIKVSAQKATVYRVANIGTGIAVSLYDIENKIGGVAHIILPESTFSNSISEQLPGKYANLAIPQLIEEFTSQGGQKRTSVVRMVGGAQLFNFGGGGGNLLNIGARNATAIRAALSKLGFAIEKADTGGNKGKLLRFILATGHIYVQQIGGTEYQL